MNRNTMRFSALSLLGLAALLTGCPDASENRVTGGGGTGGGGGVGRNFAFGELTGASSVDPSGLLTRNAGATNTTALLGKFTSLDLSNPTRIREIGKLVFSTSPQSQGQSGGLQIGSITADATGYLNLTPSLDIDYYYPTLSPKATKIAAIQRAALVSFNSDGTGRTAITSGTAFGVLTAPLAWSPNDRTIAFVSYVGDLNSVPNQINLINSDGSGLTTLTTPGTAQDRDPAWSPDGTKVAFTRNPPFGTAGTSYLMVVGSGGGSPTTLTSPSQRVAHPTWSANGSKLAFSVGSAIHKVNADGSSDLTLTTPAAGEKDTAPTWSSTNRIAYVRSAFVAGTPTHTLKIMDADGAESFSTDTVDTQTAWSPRGDKIAFSTVGTNGQNISVLTVQTSAISVLYAGGFAPSWAIPNRHNGHLLGPSGEMSGSATGMMYGGRPGGRANDTPASLTLFDSSSAANGFNLTLPADLNAGTNIAYQIEGKTASAKLNSLVYWNFSANNPVEALNGGTADGAVVTFDSSTGEVSSVAPYQIAGRTSGSPKGAKQGADLVLRGSFKAIWDKSGKNIAPQGATEIHYDAVGRLISMK